MLTLEQFIAEYQGKTACFNGWCQCVALAQHYASEVLGIPYVWHNAIDWYGQDATFLTWTKNVWGDKNSKPNVGDFVVWGDDPKVGTGVYGHIAICVDPGDGLTFKAFSQNWGGPTARVLTFSYEGVIGWGDKPKPPVVVTPQPPQPQPVQPPIPKPPVIIPKPPVVSLPPKPAVALVGAGALIAAAAAVASHFGIDPKLVTSFLEAHMDVVNALVNLYTHNPLPAIFSDTDAEALKGALTLVFADAALGLILAKKSGNWVTSYANAYLVKIAQQVAGLTILAASHMDVLFAPAMATFVAFEGKGLADKVQALFGGGNNA